VEAMRLARGVARAEAIARVVDQVERRAAGARRPFRVEPAGSRAVAEAVATARARAVVFAVVVRILSVGHVAADPVRLRRLEIGAAGPARLGARRIAADAVDAEPGDALPGAGACVPVFEAASPARVARAVARALPHVLR